MNETSKESTKHLSNTKKDHKLNISHDKNESSAPRPIKNQPSNTVSKDKIAKLSNSPLKKHPNHSTERQIDKSSQTVITGPSRFHIVRPITGTSIRKITFQPQDDKVTTSTHQHSGSNRKLCIIRTNNQNLKFTAVPNQSIETKNNEPPKKLLRVDQPPEKIKLIRNNVESNVFKKPRLNVTSSKTKQCSLSEHLKSTKMNLK